MNDLNDKSPQPARYSMKNHWGLILTVIVGFVLATCGVIESIQEGDRTKMFLLVSWLATTWQYIEWKKRAVKAQLFCVDVLLNRYTCPICQKQRKT